MDPKWAEPYRQRQRELEPIVEKAIAATLESVKSQPPEIRDHLHLGAIGAAPESLAVWFIFDTDVDMALASSAGLLAKIEATLKDNLARNGYPEEAARRIRPRFASHEEIEREGGWKQYFL